MIKLEPFVFNSHIEEEEIPSATVMKSRASKYLTLIGMNLNLFGEEPQAEAIASESQKEESSPAIQKPVKKTDLDRFFNVPNSSASDLIVETLGAGNNVAEIPDRKQQVSHGSTYIVRKNDKARQVILSGNKAEITVELSDIDKLSKNNKPAKKLFIFSLIKANEQAIHNGELTRDYISFPLQELIDTGFYGTVQSARKGFKSGMDVLTSLKLKGTIRKTKKQETKVDALEVLFTGYRIENNQCYVRLNYAVNWNFIAQYYTILPQYFFRLPNRASDLLYYIFYLARQNTKAIEDRGYFTISFRAIQHRLMLPSEVGSPNPQRDIKQPIEDAIEAIETEHSSTYKNTEFQLLPVYDDDANIRDFLEDGYLQVTLSGSFSKNFIEMSKKTAKQIEQSRKRKERIIEKATAIKMAKAMEEENKPVSPE